MDKKAAPLVHALLAIMVLAIYAQTLWFGYVNYDDDHYITKNAHVQAGFTADSVRWAFTTGDVSNWHPLTWLSYMLDYTLFGLDPSGPHMVNALLHALNCILLFEWARRATGALWRSALVAALFAVHPLHVESVAWISERKDVLSACFGFSAMLAYTHYARRPGLMRYLPVFVLLALGLLAKPMLVTLPFVLLLIDYWPLERFRNERWHRLALEKIPLMALSAASSIITVYVQHIGGSVMPLERFPFGARISNALTSYLLYLVKLLVPVNLAVFYPYPRSTALMYVAGVAVVLALVTSLVIWRARNKPYLATGWFWYAGTLVPVIGIVQVGLQSMADRYMYLPSIGLFIITAWGGWEILQKLPRAKSIAIVLSAACILLLTGVSFAQTRHWRDSETLWRHTLAAVPANPIAHVKLGNALLPQNRLPEAEVEFKKAIESGPRQPEGYVNFAMLQLMRNQFQDAIPLLQKAIELDATNGETYVNLAIAFGSLGKIEDASAAFLEALRINPKSWAAHANYATLLYNEKRFPEAASHFQNALEEVPVDTGCLCGLGASLVNMNRAREAIPYLRKVLDLQPGNAEAAQLLAQAVKAATASK